MVADIPPATPRTKGILGLDFLSAFDVYFDFTGAEMVLYQKGSAATSPLVQGMTGIPYRVLPLGLLVVNVQLYLDGQKAEGGEVLGILDTGAASSVMNWRAAQTLGLTPENPKMVNNGMILAGQVWDLRQRSMAAARQVDGL